MGAPTEDEYARFVGLYDPLTGPFLEPLRRALTAEARRLGATRAVDLCCGTGRQLLQLDAAGIPSLGLDLSPAMLHRARAQCPPRVGLLLADATATPLPGACCDLCSISFALHERPGPVRLGMLAEARRLLAPGGTLLVLDYRRANTLRRRLGHAGVWCFERAAGGEHYANYKDYLRGGGLRPEAARAGLSVRLVRSFLLGSVGLFALVPEP